MSGFFGVASKEDCVTELFYGVDYHSHLGTRRAGMAVYNENTGFSRAIHNIENTPFRTKFDKDANEMKGNVGIGCISDFEPQPLLIQSHLGSFAIATVGKINNHDELVAKLYEEGASHFQVMSGGMVNATELVAALMCTNNFSRDPLCTEPCAGVFIHYAFNKRRNLCSQRPSGKNSCYDW